MRALVLDDSKAARSFLRMILVELGFDVVDAADGAEGLERLRELGKMEIAFVDLNMPVMDGLEFIRRARKLGVYDDMRLMTITTETSKEKVAETLAAGADEYVMKPYTKEVIQEKLTLLGFDQS